MLDVSTYVETLERFVQFLDLYVQVLSGVVELEKRCGKPFKELMSEVLKPESLGEVVKRLPPEASGKLFRALTTMALISPKTSRFAELDTREKEEVVKEVKRVRDDLEDFLNALKRLLRNEHRIH